MRIFRLSVDSSSTYLQVESVLERRQSILSLDALELVGLWEVFVVVVVVVISASDVDVVSK